MMMECQHNGNCSTSTLASFPPLCWLASILLLSLLSTSLLPLSLPSSSSHTPPPPPPPPDLLSRWNTWVRSTSRQRQQSSSTSDSFSRYADYHQQALSWYIVSQRLCTLFPPAVIIGTRLLCACETPSQG